jgi:Holliday junction resolvasome RuvABC endonuclease subunit
MRAIIMGVDFSLSNTALVGLPIESKSSTALTEQPIVETIKPPMPKQASKEKRGTKMDTPETAEAKLRRLHKLNRDTADFILEHKPFVAFVEGYGFASQMAHSLGEGGGAVKLAIWLSGIDMYIVPPNLLKKFASGDGTASKGTMLKDVLDRWKFNTNDDNVADAYALTRFGESFFRMNGAKKAETLKKVQLVPGFVRGKV